MKILKKLIAIGSLYSLFTAPSFAGFYLGAGIGPEGLHFNQNAHVTRLGTFDVIDRNSFSGTGVFGTLIGGYGRTYNRWYAALEGNANWSSVQYKLTNNEYVNRNFLKSTFTVKNSEGVSLLPGILLAENALFYGRIGYANGYVKIHDSDPTIKSQTKNTNGIRYGLGFRYQFNPKWTAMMDYSQINYQNLHSTVFEPFGGVLKKTTISPNTAQVAFALLYNFDRPQAYVK